VVDGESTVVEDGVAAVVAAVESRLVGGELAGEHATTARTVQTIKTAAAVVAECFIGAST
jgi:hypothetical protein